MGSRCPPQSSCGKGKKPQETMVVGGEMKAWFSTIWSLNSQTQQVRRVLQDSIRPKSPRRFFVEIGEAGGRLQRSKSLMGQWGVGAGGLWVGWNVHQSHLLGCGLDRMHYQGSSGVQTRIDMVTIQGRHFEFVRNQGLCLGSPPVV